MLRGAIILLLLVLFVLGCDDDDEPRRLLDLKAEVESNTSWSRFFENRTVDGSGNQTVDLPDVDIACCTVQKQTEEGRLKVSVVPGGESAESTAAYGVVTVCRGQ